MNVKKKFLLFFIVALALLFSCTNVIRDYEPMYVSFTFDGVDYNWKGGIKVGPPPENLSFSGAACGMLTYDGAPGNDSILIFASPQPADLSGANPDDYLTINIPSITTTPPIISQQPTRIILGGITVWNCDTAADVSVTRFDSAGGTIEGTFSGTDPIGGLTVTNGIFYVNRISDYVIYF